MAPRSRTVLPAARRPAIARQIAALHAASWKAAYRGLFADAYLDGDVEGERLRYWQRRIEALAAGTGEIFLATIGAVPAGFLCIENDTEPEWGAFVDNLHVLPRWQGANLGGRLLDRGAAWARGHGQRQLYLWVFEKNYPARRFYARDGWQLAEKQVHDIPGGGRRSTLRLIKRI